MVRYVDDPKFPETLQRGDSGRRILHAVRSGEVVESSIEARPREGEKNVPEVARILREHLNRAGAEWHEPEICANPPSRDERGVDFILRHNTSRMECQVTRLGCKDHKLWHRIACGETVEITGPPAAWADEVKDAIARKARNTSPKDRESLTLVIDSIETPAFLMGVPSEFQRIHGSWAEQLGFHAIWLVGPASSLTAQLT